MHYLFILKVTNTVLVDVNHRNSRRYILITKWNRLSINFVFVNEFSFRFILLTTFIMVIYGVKSFSKMKNYFFKWTIFHYFLVFELNKFWSNKPNHNILWKSLLFCEKVNCNQLCVQNQGAGKKCLLTTSSLPFNPPPPTIPHHLFIIPLSWLAVQPFVFSVLINSFHRPPNNIFPGRLQRFRDLA